MPTDDIIDNRLKRHSNLNITNARAIQLTIELQGKVDSIHAKIDQLVVPWKSWNKPNTYAFCSE